MAVRRSMFWSFVGDGSMILSSLITAVIVARLLTPAQMGVFAIAIAVMAVLQSMAQMGLGNYVIREKALYPALKNSVVTIAALQGLLITSVLVAVAPVVGDLQHSEEVTRVIYIIAAAPFFGSIEAVAVGLWSKRFNFPAIARVAITRAVVQTSLTVWLALQGWGAASMAFGYLAGMTLGFALSFPGLLPLRPNLAHWRQLVRFGGLWMLLGGVRTLNARLPEFALGRLAGLAASGYYNRGSASIDLVSRGGLDPLAKVLLPALVAEHEKSGDLASGIIRLSGTLSAIFWPILAALALLSEDVVLVLYGEQWRAAAPVVSILCAWLAVSILGAGTGETLLILGRLGAAAKIEVGRTCAGILLIALAAPHGIAAVASVRVLENAIFLIPYLFLIHRLSGMSARKWAGAHFASAKITLLAVTPLVVLIAFFDLPGPPFVRLAIASTLFLISFASALYLLRHPLSGEITRVLRYVWARGGRPKDVPGE